MFVFKPSWYSSFDVDRLFEFWSFHKLICLQKLWRTFCKYTTLKFCVPKVYFTWFLKRKASDFRMCRLIVCFDPSCVYANVWRTLSWLKHAFRLSWFLNWISNPWLKILECWARLNEIFAALSKLSQIAWFEVTFKYPMCTFYSVASIKLFML